MEYLRTGDENSRGVLMLRRSPRLAILLLLRPICYKETRVKRVFKKVRRRRRAVAVAEEWIANQMQPCSEGHSRLLVTLAVLMVAVFAGLVFKMLSEQSMETLDHPKNPAIQETSGAAYNLDNLWKIFGRDTGGQIEEENFALMSSGASVVRCSKSFYSGAKLCTCGFCWDYLRSPDIILKRHNTPGNCWAMEGAQGFVVIRLSETICPAAVALDHISQKASVFGETSSAPRNFSIYGLKDAFEEAEEGALLGSFIFKTNTFPVQKFQLKRSKEYQFLYLMLKISSNYGHPNYTCVYSVRIYGRRVN